jgi:hypothetical protein
MQIILNLNLNNRWKLFALSLRKFFSCDATRHVNILKLNYVEFANFLLENRIRKRKENKKSCDFFLKLVISF